MAINKDIYDTTFILLCIIKIVIITPTPILEEEENRAASTLTNTIPHGGGDHFGTAIVSRLGLELSSSKCNSTKAHAINKTFTRVLEAQPCNQDSCIDTT
jgi:hypothetical protein